MADNKSREVIGGKRMCGKSTELIKRSHETGIRILTANKQMARMLMNESKKMGLEIKPPLTPDAKLEHFEDVEEVLIDEVEMVLQQLIGKRVAGMSTSMKMNEFYSIEKQKELSSQAKSMGKLTAEVSIDVSDALKGLKAVQREARKTAKELKEVESLTMNKYLVIELDELGNVPRVFHNGEEISSKIKVGFNWDTANEKYPNRQSICIDYYDVDVNGKSERKGIHVLKGSRS